MSRLLFILAFVFAVYGITRAQNFNYTVSTDSVSWNELNTQTILNGNNSAWNFSYKIPIGFTFSFLGRSFDSLTIETNGYLVFDNDRNYAMTAFSGVGDHIDSLGNHAIIGYELSGTNGNHILKIQYLNCSPYATGNEVQSWQVWLKENGNAEFRIGCGQLRHNNVTTTVWSTFSQEDSSYAEIVIDTIQRFRLGFLNMNMNDTLTNGIVLEGNPVSPQSEPLVPGEAIPILTCVPAQGYRYVFTPQF